MGGKRPGAPSRDRGEREDRLSPEEMRDLSAKKVLSNPFASFFKKDEGEAGA